MPTIKVRALKAFETDRGKVRKGQTVYLPPSKARELESAGKVEMILTRYPERLEAEPIEQPEAVAEIETEAAVVEDGEELATEDTEHGPASLE